MGEVESESGAEAEDDANHGNKKHAMHNKLRKSMRHKDKQLLTPYLQRNTYSGVFAFDFVRGILCQKQSFAT